MKTLILLAVIALVAAVAVIYGLCLLLFRSRWFEVPDYCGNVGEEEGMFTGDEA